MRYTAEDEEEPPRLRALRRLVMLLMVVLMLGILAIAATIVIRLGFLPLNAAPEGVPAAEIVLPDGAGIVATGQGPGTVHVVLRGPDGAEVLHVFDAATGAELSRTALVR